VQQETLASLGALVAGIAHEVNTPLGLVLSGVSQLNDDLSAVHNKLGSGKLKKSELDAFVAKGRRTGDMVVAHAERAAGLIRNFKQIAVDRASGESRQVSLGAYVGEVIESLKPLWKRQPVTVITDLDDDIAIRTDPGAIAHILQNFVTNSLLHAFDPGGAGTMRVTVARNGDEAVIAFADDGKGMDPDVLKKIYDPFFTTRRGSGGTGLGMNIVYNMVIGRLKGHIRCESSPGQGTRFFLSLPLRT
jgi:signal transduction histidine kinase